MQALLLLLVIIGEQLHLSFAITASPSAKTNPVPTVMPTTTAQLSPSTSTTSTSSTPTVTSISSSSGLYSSSFSFRRKLASTGNSSLVSNSAAITLVVGAPLLNYSCVALSQDASKWVAITDEGLTFISLDYGTTFQQGVTLPGFQKVKITAKGEVVFVPNTLSANGYASSTTLLVYDSPERLLPTPAPSTRPTLQPQYYEDNNVDIDMK